MIITVFYLLAILSLQPGMLLPSLLPGHPAGSLSACCLLISPSGPFQQSCYPARQSPAWISAKASPFPEAWTRPCVTCSRWRCLGRGVGLDDLQMSLPTLMILWFCGICPHRISKGACWHVLPACPGPFGQQLSSEAHQLNPWAWDHLQIWQKQALLPPLHHDKVVKHNRSQDRSLWFSACHSRLSVTY